MRRPLLTVTIPTAGIIIVATGWWARAGDLNPPPGPVQSTMKPLDIVEPRTPVSSLPFTISESGSFFLTRDLLGGAGITISADNVTLDLMGYSLGPGTGDGILVTGDRKSITIKNGTITGWSGDGVDAMSANNSRLENLFARSNGADGLRIGSGGQVLRCAATNNVGHGIDGEDSTYLAASTARENGGDGINLRTGSTVTGCIVRGNTNDGIFAAVGSTVHDCTASSNDVHGIRVEASSTVTNSTVRENGGDGINVRTGSTVTTCTSRGNLNHGIFAAVGSTVHHCTVFSNTVYGIRVEASCTVTNSTVRESGSDGVNASNGCSIINCSSDANTGVGIFLGGNGTVRECTTWSNDADGIRVASNTYVTGNNCSGNGAGPADGSGILVTGSSNRVEDNHVVANDRGIEVNGTGNFIVRNTASGATGAGSPSADFDIADGNHFALISIDPGPNWSTGVVP